MLMLFQEEQEVIAWLRPQIKVVGEGMQPFQPCDWSENKSVKRRFNSEKYFKPL